MRNVLALIMLAVVSVASPSPTPVGPTPTYTAPTPPVVLPPQTIMYVGDSITAGGLVAPADRIDQRLRQALYGIVPPTATIVNAGVGGQALLGGTTVPNLADTFPGLIAPLQAGDIVIVQIGTNDLFTYAGDTAWTTAYVNMVQAAWDKGLHVLICQITPISSTHWPQELLRQHLNQWLSDHFGNTFLARYPDVLHNQSTGQTWIDPLYGLPDGIHVNPYAYYRMADMDVAQLVANSWLN